MTPRGGGHDVCSHSDPFVGRGRDGKNTKNLFHVGHFYYLCTEYGSAAGWYPS